jgi:hypothetical protein
MQKIAKLNFVYGIQVVRNIFEFYFGCSKMNQEKYAYVRTSEPWLLYICGYELRPYKLIDTAYPKSTSIFSWYITS